MRISLALAAVCGVSFSAAAENLVVNGNDTSANGTAYSLEEGGVWTYDLVTFGNDAATSPEVNSYVRLDMLGGLFSLGAGGLRTGVRWNSADPANSIYSVRLSGGTVRATADTGISLETEIPGSGAVTLDTQANAFGFFGPLVGGGALVKSGSGLLVLGDSSAFSGTLSVDAGTVEVLGTGGGAAVSETPVVWTADDAATGKADGAAVETWLSHDETIEAKNPVTDGTIGYAAPVVKLGAFGGHAGLVFNKSGLEIAKELNPLAGASSWTMAVVFKTQATSGSGDASGTSWQQGMNLLGNADATDGFGLAYVKPGSVNYLAFGASFGAPSAAQRVGSRPGVGLNDGNTHVAICSLKKNTLLMNIDGFVTNVVASVSEADYPCFSDSPLYFGFAKLNRNPAVESRFNGTIAEIRFYRNRALDANEQRQLGLELGAKYALPLSGMAAFCASGSGAVAGEIPAPSPVPPVWPAGADVFDAEDLNSAEDGSTVERWQSSGVSVATKGAANADTYGSVGPTLVKNAINGRSALRFSAESKTALGCPSSGSYAHRLAGKDDVSVAVVFRTTEPGQGSSATYAEGLGLVSTFQSAANNNELELAFISGGSVKAGIGTANGTAGGVARLTDAKPNLLNDGKPHVAVLSVSKTDGRLAMMVDGRYSSTDTTIVNARAAANLVFGIFKANPGKVNDRQHFTGDIAMVRLYDKALSRAEMDTLTQAACATYGFRPAAKLGAAWGADGAGLGAKSVSVASGATLRLPNASVSPYAVAAGASFGGAGTVEGTLALADGAVLKCAAEPLTVENLIVSGRITVDITDFGEGKTILSYGSAAIDAETSWSVISGGEPVKARIVSDDVRKVLKLKYDRGLMLLLR